MNLRHFVVSISLLLPIAASAQGYLENPVAGSTESGIGLVSGWHCTAKEVTVLVDGVALGKSGVGSVRNDTNSVCGHVNTGFSLLYNYNKPEAGPHEITVYADGQLLEKRAFNTVRSGGMPFLEGRSNITAIPNFPQNGNSTVVQWSQAKQSFVVIGAADTNTLDGTYTLYRATLQTSNYGLIDTEADNGFAAEGTMSVSGTSYSQKIAILLDGTATQVDLAGRMTDMGYYLYDQQNGNQVVVVERGAALITSVLYQDAFLGWVNELDYWIKTR